MLTEYFWQSRELKPALFYIARAAHGELWEADFKTANIIRDIESNHAK